MTKPCPDDLAAFKHEPADYEVVFDLAKRCEMASEYAARHPGHVETSGQVIADLYSAISELATFSARRARGETSHD